VATLFIAGQTAQAAACRDNGFSPSSTKWPSKASTPASIISGVISTLFNRASRITLPQQDDVPYEHGQRRKLSGNVRRDRQ
jgi:hypothetical protein